MFNFNNKNNDSFSGQHNANTSFFGGNRNNNNFSQDGGFNPNIKFSNVTNIPQYVPQFTNNFVEDNLTLQKVLDSFLDDDKVFIMCEYQKEYSYNEKLSTLQIANGNKYYSIDMMSEYIDENAIRNFLMYNKIKKVVYNAEKFLSTIYQRYKKLPQNVFDITTAAMLCGIDKKLQFREMLITTLGKNYKIKDPIKINYKQRPLNARAIDRSILNVIHLEDLYNFMYNELKIFNRFWIHDEIVAEMLDEDKYTKSIEESWTQIKFHTSKMDVVRRIKKLSEWRELTAKKMNLHSQLLMTDKVLLDVAERNPTCYEELTEIKNLNKTLLRPVHTKRIISAITAAQKLILEQTDIEAHIDELPAKYIPLADMFKILLRMKAKEHKIAPKLIASSADLAIIASSKDSKVKCLEGWRFEIFGQEAIKMKEGKIMLVYENNNLTIFNLEESINSLKQNVV